MNMTFKSIRRRKTRKIKLSPAAFLPQVRDLWQPCAGFSIALESEKS